MAGTGTVYLLLGLTHGGPQGRHLLYSGRSPRGLRELGLEKGATGLGPSCLLIALGPTVNYQTLLSFS